MRHQQSNFIEFTQVAQPSRPRWPNRQEILGPSRGQMDSLDALNGFPDKVPSKGLTAFDLFFFFVHYKSPQPQDNPQSPDLLYIPGLDFTHAREF